MFQTSQQKRMNVGAAVVVVASPYYAIPDGARTTIEAIKLHHFGPGLHLYILSNLPCKAFLEFEIEEEINHAIQAEK